MGKIKCLNCGAELVADSQAACPACGIGLSHTKFSFLTYLGAEDSLAGYQRSYKLVLLKSIFEECLIGNAPKVRNVVERFRAYYVQRKSHNLLIDKDVDIRIADIESSSLEDVFEVVKMNPYDAIHKQGFLKIDELNGVFVLQRGINDLSANEIKGLLDLIQKKLQLYYTKIGSEALPRENGPFLLSVQGTDNKNELLDDTDKAHFIPNIVAPKTPETPISAYTLEDLGLSNRAYNSLRRNGICTTAALFEAVSTGMVRKFKNIGAMTVDELERIVESLKNNTFIPGMPAAANCGSDNGIVLDIDSTVADFYPENSFKLFRQYCNDHNIRTIADLTTFNFEVLYSVDGFGPAKVDRAKKRYCALAEKLGLPFHSGTSPENEEKQAFVNAHESNWKLSIGILRFFGATPKTLTKLQDAGILTIQDIQKSSLEMVGKLVGKQKCSELCKILETFQAPLYTIGASILDECSKDRDFEIYIQRADGHSLQNVADTFGLTRERIRQICSRFENRITPVMQAIAETILSHNDSAYFTEQQILDVFDDDNYDKIIISALKNCSEYTYLDFAQTFVYRKDFPDIEDKLQQIATEIVGDGINLFEELGKIEFALSSAGYGFITTDSFLELLIKYNYKFYGDYVIKTRKSYGLLCAEIVADEFPNGIHTNSKDEIAHLRTALESKYGKLDVPENDRSFISRTVSYLVQAGRSTYIASKNIVVDDSVLLDIKSYIDNLNQRDIYYNQIFAEYEGILMMTSNVDNPAFLHGVLVWRFPNDYTYSRDYLRKPDAGETASLAEQIRKILAEEGHPMTKKQILSQFPGMTDAMFNNAFYSVPWLIQWEYGVFNCSDNLNITEEETIQFQKVIERLLRENDGYCSQDLLYKNISQELPGIYAKNDIKSSQSIFYIAAYLFSESLLFSRPHIALKERFTSLDSKTIALELMGCPTMMNADEFFALARKFQWSDVTAGLVFSNIEHEYVRLDKNTYQATDSFELNDQDRKYVSDLLLRSAADEWYLPLQRFADSEDFTPGGLHINEFLIDSIVSKYGLDWHIVNPQVKDRRYAKGILVKNTQNITAYDQLIAKILSDAGFQTLSPGQLLSFLQIHQLAFKIIPKELEVSKYFEVSEEQFTLIQAQEG